VEHRLNERVSVKTKLEVFRNGKCLGKIPVKDMSAGGIGFYDQHARLNHHDFLDILVPADFIQEKSPARIQVLVVRHQGDVVGTMLAPSNSHTLNAA